jgi:sulfite exporter TauE/SafE
MDNTLLAAALLMGLAGGPHCLAMCGAACSAVAGSGRATSPSLLALHGARLVGYSLAGAIGAAGVGLAGFAGAAPLLRPLWAIVHVAAVALGMWLLWTGRTPPWFTRTPPAIAAGSRERPIRVVRALPRTARAALGGACWVAMPCGLLHSTLLVAALASTPLAGAATMAAFAVGSTGVLVLGQSVWSRLRRGSDAGALLPVRAAGALLAGASLFALWHGLGAAICAAAA